MSGFSQQIADCYANYKENSFQGRRFSYAFFSSLISKLKKELRLEIAEAGVSEENRAIYQIKFGTGKTKLMLWSQMHGDEPTATMAIFDLLNFLTNPPRTLVDTVLGWSQEFSIYFIPVLNPDGLTRFSRFNALGIDLNRDAMAQQAKESELLWKLHSEIQPDFAFNLHDQDRFYSVGDSLNPATISFLANPIGELEKTPERVKSMQLICQMNVALQKLIPNQVGRYVADFDPTSFGDSFQKVGKCTLLIESGASKNDWDRNVARKMNFVAILVAFESIRTKSYEVFSESDYHQTPQNKSRMFDFLIRKVKFKAFDKEFELDLGLNILENMDGNKPRYRLVLENFGDLQNNDTFHDLKGGSVSLRIEGNGMMDFENPDEIDEMLKAVEILTAVSDDENNTAYLYRGMEIGIY